MFALIGFLPVFFLVGSDGDNQGADGKVKDPEAERWFTAADSKEVY